MTATPMSPCLESLIIQVDISITTYKGFRMTIYYLNQLAKDISLIILSFTYQVLYDQ